MAPYDIPAGSKYAQVISRAIKECSCFLLLLTNAAQESTWVAKEVERAINYRKVIIPVQLEPMTLNDEFEFYISTDQLTRINPEGGNEEALAQIIASVGLCVGGIDMPEQEENTDDSEVDDNSISNIITLNDEDGNDIQFEFLDLIEYNGAEYVVLYPVDDDGEVVILKVESLSNDEESYVSAEDDAVEAVFEIFKKRNKEQFNFT